MRVGLGGRRTIGLDGDVKACTPVVSEQQGFPNVTLSRRIFDDYDEDGNIEYSWETVVDEAASTFRTQRNEHDDRAALTVIEAHVSVAYHGDLTAQESWVLKLDGVVWKISSVAQVPGMIQLVCWSSETGDGRGD